MPERPTQTDILLEEGNSVLSGGRGRYRLLSHANGVGGRTTEDVSATFRHVAEAVQLSGVRCQLSDPSSDEIFLSRLDLIGRGIYLVKARRYLPHAATCSIDDYFNARCGWGRYDNCFLFSPNSCGLCLPTGMHILLPDLEIYEHYLSGKSYLIGSDGHPLELWMETVGRYYPIGLSTEELLTTKPGGDRVVVDVPARDKHHNPERVEITVGGDETRVLTVSRSGGDKSATICLSLPQSLDAIAVLPDISDPQAIFQRMQDIKQLLLGMKPVVT